MLTVLYKPLTELQKKEHIVCMLHCKKAHHQKHLEIMMLIVSGMHFFVKIYKAVIQMSVLQLPAFYLVHFLTWKTGPSLSVLLLSSIGS